MSKGSGMTMGQELDRLGHKLNEIEGRLALLEEQHGGGVGTASERALEINTRHTLTYMLEHNESHGVVPVTPAMCEALLSALTGEGR